MTVVALGAQARRATAPMLYAVSIFTSAALVFSVEPMIAKMILPKLGGSPAVWNASMAFFQTALLAGYAYAHVLQKLASVRIQALVHVAALAAAAAFLPLHVTALFGDPPVDDPVLWLLGVLLVSVGPPFAVLSATAPLLQAWFARARPQDAGQENTYGLYAASNLGSMVALLAYPAVIEPAIALQGQTLWWTVGYGLFALLAVSLAWQVWRTPATATGSARLLAGESHVLPAERITWRDRATWVALAAIPSSLMLGVTTYITTDVASAPFMWVVPLALYLLTFVIAFQAKPSISRERALLWQGVVLTLCVGVMCLGVTRWSLGLPLHLAAFFFSALICHQALVARRPHSEKLTDFYLLMSLGGVVGGAFNALLAPVLFDTVVEYPLALALVGLVRPWGLDKLSRRDLLLATLGVSAAVLGFILRANGAPAIWIAALLPVAGACALLLRGRALLFTAVIGALLVQATFSPDGRQVVLSARSFFGVNRVLLDDVPGLGGPVKLLVHGTTLHGVQPQSPAMRCQPTGYYAARTGIGQTYSRMKATSPALNIGVVGLGGGTVAAYLRPTDRLRFFEIDPVVKRIALDRRQFTYIDGCAKGAVDVVLGDARLTLAKEPAGTYDLIHLDAFSSDAIPTHLLTAEALELYFRALKPGGVLLLHISNRNLALEGPAAATAHSIGAVALINRYRRPADVAPLVETSTDVMVLAKSAAALAPFAADPHWRPAQEHGSRPWTDDYTNIAGALVYRALHPRS